MKQALLVLIAGTVLSGLAAAYASATQHVAVDELATSQVSVETRAAASY